MSSTGELIDIERVTISSERGRWKSTSEGNSLAAYSTSRPVLRRGDGSNPGSLAGDERQHREDRLHEHPILPLPALTQFEIRRIALRGMEAGITQDDHLLLTLPNQPLKRVIGDIGRAACPPHDQPPLIEQQTEFAADNPAMVGQAFA